MASDAESVPALEEQPTLWWDLLVGIVPLIALLPMLLFEASHLWSQEYMRFVPLTLLAVVAIVVANSRSATATKHPYRRWTAIGILIAGVLVYMTSVWQFSPWFSHLALVLAFCAWALGRFGNLHWATIAAWTGLLATTLRLPGAAGDSLINSLQVFAAWCCTKALDALGIPCINNGMLVETRGLSLLADEVCGGWASLFAFLSFAVFLAVIQHRSFMASVCTLLLVPLWSVLSNFLRLLTISLAFEYAERDISMGWDNRLLEFTTAGLVLILIWMSSNLFARLFEPLPATDAEFGPIFSALNKMFCWPQPDPIEETEPEDEYERKEFLRRKAKREAAKPKWNPFDWQADGRAVWAVRGSAVIMLVGALLPISRLASQGVNDLNFGLPRISSEAVEQYADEDSLPGELEGGWKLSGFERVRRRPRSGFGEFGLVWSYVANEKRFEASIDLPFLGWHDPVAQRELQGWTVESEQIDSKENWVWCESEMENELGGRAYALYCMLTPAGQPYSKLPSRLAAIAGDREADFTSDSETLSAQSYTQVTYQFQVFIESGERLSRADQKRIRDRFLELRGTVRELGSASSASE